MSLLIGRWQKDTQKFPENFDLLYKGIITLPHQQYDKIVLANMAFGRALVWDTPEAVFDTMPQKIASKNLIFMAEGRLDNRQQIETQLRLPKKHYTDTTLILEAYLKWGKDTPSKLLGDWAFVAYNEQEEELFLARDHYGYTCLYYTFDQTHFQFSSSKKSFLSLDNFPLKLNIPYVLDRFTFGEMSGNTDLPFQNIHYLPPSHTLTYKKGQIRLESYWFPQNTPLLIYKNHQDYADELKGILTQAIEARLRSYKPVASTLSGGLDSSTVTSLTAQILAAQNQDLTTFSHIPAFPEELKGIKMVGEFLDESEHISATVAKYPNINAHLLRTEHISPLDGIEAYMDMLDNFIHGASNANWLTDIFNNLKTGGFGAFLTGDNGNLNISYTGIVYQQSLKALYQQRGLKGMVKLGILTPIAYKYFSAFLNSQKGLTHYLKTKSYLNPSILKEWKIIEHLKTSKINFSTYIPDAKTGMFNLLTKNKTVHCQFGGDISNYLGIEKRSPTNDVRVMEYCLSIPNAGFFDEKGRSRQIVRRMMKGDLPDKVLYETAIGRQWSDIYFRLMLEKERVEALLSEVCANPTFSYFMNTKKMWTDWHAFKTAQFVDSNVVNNFLKTLMFGLFLKRYNL